MDRLTAAARYTCATLVIDGGERRLRRVAAGGAERRRPAVAVLYRDLHPRLLRYLSAREPRAADDLESEVWLAVAKGIARFAGGEESFRAWVFSIARRRLADFRRTAARRATVPVPNEELDRAGTDDPEAVVLEDLSSSAAAAFVVATLSPDQAEIVLLRVLGGLTVEHVAELLGKRPGTVRVLQHRALRRLHAELVKGGVTQ
jgi:RNA polymerase sigma-70 factor (ECF subfamily)